MSVGEPLYPQANPEQPGPVDVRHRLPVESTVVVPRGTRESRVDTAAQAVGSAVGQAVQTVRDLPDRLRLQQRVKEMKQRFTLIRGRAQEDARDKAQELKDKAGETWADTRTRAARLAHQYPFGVLAAAAGLGVVLGVALRIWRDRD